MRFRNSSVKVESPRPTGRKKNKPAPVPPGMITPQAPSLQLPKGSSPTALPLQQMKTPEKEERRPPVGIAEERQSHVDSKPSLPPSGPDSKRLSTLPSDKKPALAPRPSVNVHPATSQSHTIAFPNPGIGFEPIEQELRRQGSVRTSASAAAVTTLPHTTKSDDDGVDLRKPSSSASHKRISSFDNLLASTSSTNPTHHPNAVSIFGGFTPPTPQDRSSRFDGEKAKPSVPERPAVIKLQGIEKIAS